MLLYHLDKIIIVFLLIYAVKEYRKGFILSVFGFLPVLGAFLGTKLLNPVLNKFLRETFLFEKITTGVSAKLNFSEAIGNVAANSQAQLIESMKIPSFLKTKLIENNNPVIYDILDVSSINDYIVKFISNGLLNIICVIVLFVGIFLALKLLIRAFDFASRLPVLNFFNKLLGMFVGLSKAVIIIWFIFTVMFFFSFSPTWQPVFEGLDKSVLGKLLYNNNMLLSLVLNIFT